MSSPERRVLKLSTLAELREEVGRRATAGEAVSPVEVHDGCYFRLLFDCMRQTDVKSGKECRFSVKIDGFAVRVEVRE